ncbi:GGDEF domain-containing protein [Clostridium estertheticum]|uniref:GGDEF domain-containing protein n=1 Tax=Clostridium estertheticum TaxID=238834 RepID=A0AA47I8S4_9CLOT|nr:GGDEF domain-containing protein [Clostridium estertheticum]MBU3154096.1 GGDEF domain-containing protein [Clostridium estertheticum]MBU3199744.1 GGDEF domain-containing protein [Clostridium estertheticum]WAG62888.1 GGDEF domain-containing protein [Clostridium estertheticum]WAG67603.1 GGDEF domain-containing protein [Clostridium estertheticum]
MDKTLISIDEITSRVKDLIKNNEGPFSVVTCDIDNLNNINKIHGNDIGDEVISKVISIFSNNLSDTDLINRSGDEFTLLLVKKGAERSFMDLEEIRRYLSDNTFDLKSLTKTENINITLSFGVASYPRDSKNVIDLLRVADSGLFRAKKEGRNRICLSEAESMVLKSSYFTKTQLDRLSELSKSNDKTEAFLLREALDGLFKKYNK